MRNPWTRKIEVPWSLIGGTQPKAEAHFALVRRTEKGWAQSLQVQPIDDRVLMVWKPETKSVELWFRTAGEAVV